MKFSSVLITLLWLSVAVTIPVLASVSPAGSRGILPSSSSVIVQPLPTTSAPLSADAAGSVLSAAKVTVHLPIVAQAYRSRQRCSPASPFSLQIAALHQVTSESQALGADALAEAQWLAGYDAAFPSLVEQLQASGACWARLRIDWAWLQPEAAPDYLWAAYHDEKLRLVAEAGVQVIAYIDGVPAWAGDAPYGPIDADHLDEFAQFLTALVNHYQQPPYNVHHWELSNEPDMTEPPGSQHGWGLHSDQYAAMLAVAYPAIKAADPTATVLMGGVAQDWFIEYDGPFYRYFTDEVMGAGGAENMDGLNFHYFPDYRREWERWDPGSDARRYGTLPAPTCGDLFDGQGQSYDAGGIDLIAKTTHFRNRLRVCYAVEKPIWITELGEHGYAADPISLVQQARYVIQGYARGLAAGAENITWFALVSPPYDPHEQGLLFEEDFSPKPAFYAYRTLTSELAGYRYTDTLAIPSVEGYAFRDEYQQEKLIAWWAADWPPSGSLVVASTSRIRVVDREGTVSYVEDGADGDMDGNLNGAVELRLTADPVFVSP